MGAHEEDDGKQKKKGKALDLGDIKAMLQQSELEERVAQKRAQKVAKRYAKSNLTPKEEKTAMKIRKQLANINGYLYNPDYKYTHLRTQPCGGKPESSGYTNEQDEKHRGISANDCKAEATIGQNDTCDEPETGDDGLEDLMPSITYLAMPARPVTREGERSMASPTPQSSVPSTGDSMAYTPTANSSVAGDGPEKINTAQGVHPWPDLWSGCTDKGSGPSLVGFGAFLPGMAPFCGEESRKAYDNTYNTLKMCWFVMTGQMLPTADENIQQAVKSMFKQDLLEMDVRLKTYEERLACRKEALSLPGDDWKRVSPGSSKSSPSTSLSVTIASNKAISPALGPPSPACIQSPVPMDNPCIGTNEKRSSVHSSLGNHSGQQTPSRRGLLALICNAFRATTEPKSPNTTIVTAANGIPAAEKAVATPKDAPSVPLIPDAFGGHTTPQLPVSDAKASPPLSNVSTIPSRRRQSSASASAPAIEDSLSFSEALTIEGDEQVLSTPECTRSHNGPFLQNSLTAFENARQLSLASESTNHQASRHYNTPASGRLSLASSSSSSPPDVSPSAPGASKHTRGDSQASSSCSSSYDVLSLDAHVDELVREFKLWDGAQDPVVHEGAGRPGVKDALRPVEYEELRTMKDTERDTLVEKVKSITHADLRAQAMQEHHDSRYPPDIPGHHAQSFAALPELALRIARHLLELANNQLMLHLRCNHETKHYDGKANSECPWNASSKCPLSVSYLQAGYSAAWATHFVQWAQEQQQVWKYENVNVPTADEPGGGFRRPGRTAEATSLLNIVDEKYKVYLGNRDIEVEGEGGVLKQFALVAEARQQDGTKNAWKACEDQLRRLSTMATAKQAERAGLGIASGPSPVCEGSVVSLNEIPSSGAHVSIDT